MRRAALALLFSLALPLPAQVFATVGDNRLSLAQVLRFHPEGLVVCQAAGSGASLLEPLGAALAQDPAALLDLTVQDLDPGSKVGREAARLLGWGPARPHWALLGPDRRVHAEGVEAPTAASLAEAYRASGLRTRAGLLRDFLREHPGHREAQAQLLLDLRGIGEKRMARLPEASTGAPGAASSKPTTAPDLPEDLDRAAWGEYADRFEAYLREDAWLDADPDASSPLALAAQLPDGAERSPRLRRLAGSLIGLVEDRLRRKPSDDRRWAVWLSFRATAGRGRPSEVLAGLPPLPGSRRWPPAAALEAYVADARESGDWRMVEPVLQSTYDETMEFVQALQTAGAEDAGGQPRMGASFGYGGWTGETALLVEAKLRLGKEAEADRLVEAVLGRVPNPAIARQAAALARECGHPAAAERWERLASR